MKSMNNFAAQQLSKKQMNEVKGGDRYIWCAAIIDGRADMGVSAAETVAEAERLLKEKYEGVYDEVHVVCDERFN